MGQLIDLGPLLVGEQQKTGSHVVDLSGSGLIWWLYWIVGVDG